MDNVILCDNQDITRLGVKCLCEQAEAKVTEASTKRQLVIELLKNPQSVVVIDYPLFDYEEVEMLLVVASRFPDTRWMLFSEELSESFIRRLLIDEDHFSIVMKQDSLKEIQECLLRTLRDERYICQQVTDMLLKPKSKQEEAECANLTPTEMEILKAVALGKTTRQIASERCCSINTIVTHRKNIFRKLGVNNVHEATKYAFRTGLVDAAEYFI